LEEKMNRNSLARNVAFLGVMLALVFVFLLLETFVLSGLFGNLTPAALTIPLSIAIAVTGRKYNMFIGGTLLGVSSFFLAIIIANAVFLNPLISILPRVFIGITAYFSCLAVRKIFSKSSNKFLKRILPYSVAGAVGVLTNTVLVIFMMLVFNSTTLAAVLTTMLLINFVAEVVSAVILVPVFANVINKVLKQDE